MWEGGREAQGGIGRRRAQQKRDIDAKVIQAGMFNESATHDERQHLLQSLIAKGATDIGEGVHSEEEVNAMLARTPEEFHVFQKVSSIPPLAFPASSSAPRACP